ncbi:hypothetical protein YWY31_08490 [Paenibacillus illinoisensis]
MPSLMSKLIFESQPPGQWSNLTDQDDSYVYGIPLFWWLGDRDADESRLPEEQRNAIDNAVKLIERDVPFDGCDIKM